MSYNVNLVVKMHGYGDLNKQFPATKIRSLGGLKSGRAVRLKTDKAGAPIDIVIRPYYRKFKDGELHIFAVEVPADAKKHS